MNWPVNIVISNGKYVCTVRRRTSCGKWISSEAKIVFRIQANQFPGMDRIKTRTRRRIANAATRDMGLMAFDDLSGGGKDFVGIEEY